jgi:DNA-binding response OmpR family regulator
MTNRIPYTRRRMGETPITSHSLARILVIEDDPDIREVIRMHLEKELFSVSTAEHGLQGLALAQKLAFTLVILDLGLPGPDGLEICRQLSALSPRPLILILTARSAEIDRVRGLDHGADDYVVKPFSMLELVARVRALLRRPPLAVEQLGDQAERTVVAGALVIDRWERCAKLRTRRIELTTKEFDLLLWFGRHPQRVFSRAELLDAVWGTGYEGYEHTVNSHLNRLRAKIEQDPSHPAVLVTVRGGGYKLVPPSAESPSVDPTPLRG